MTQTNKTKQKNTLTSSTVRGMHILYSFSNIFPPRAGACVCLSLSLPLSSMFSLCVRKLAEGAIRPPAAGMCVMSGDVSAHVEGMVGPGYGLHPELRRSSFMRSRRGLFTD